MVKKAAGFKPLHISEPAGLLRCGGMTAKVCAEDNASDTGAAEAYFRGILTEFCGKSPVL